jgi:hypothetical protein
MATFDACIALIERLPRDRRGNISRLSLVAALRAYVVAT